jgi:hypothetical protein
MSKFLEIGDIKSCYVYRGTTSLELKIVANEAIQQNRENKFSIDRNIGYGNVYDRTGYGDGKITLTVFIDSKQSYLELVEFFDNKEPFIFVYLGEFSQPLSLASDLGYSHYDQYKGQMTLVFTDAYNIYAKEEQELILFNKNPASKKSFLDKLKKFGQDVFDFTSNTNESIGAYTNTIAAYTTALEQIGNGVGGMSSIITSPIDSIRNSASQVVGGLSSVITGLNNTISAITSLPSVVDGIIDSFLLIGEQLSNLFSGGTAQDRVKQSTDFLGFVAEKFIEIDENKQSANPNTQSLTFNEETGEYKIEFRPEFANSNKNDSAINVLLLSSILISLYENSSTIVRWNTVDLESLRNRTESIYNYLLTKKLDNDVRYQLEIARTEFLRIFKVLVQEARNVVELNLNIPTFLSDAVYKVNGNYNYLEETKKLNNVVGGVVEGKIKVISNE